MKDQNRTKKQLIDELNTLRRQIAELKALAAQRQPARETFQSSQTQYRTVFDSLEDAIHVIDSDFRLILFNKRFERWNGELGLETQVIGKNLFEVFPFLREHVRNEYIRVFDTGKMLITEEITTVDDREIITETRKIPIYTDGMVGWVVTVIRDITDRMQTEKRLRESEERFRETVDLLPTVIVEFDTDGYVTYVNNYGFQLLGYSLSDVEQGFRISWLLPEDEHSKHTDRVRRLIEEERVLPTEYRLLRKNGSVIYALVTSAPIYKDGDIVGIRSTATDITERKKAEEALRESEKRFRMLIETMQEGLGVLDENGTITYINNRICEMSGYSKEELIGRAATDFIDEPYLDQVYEQIERRREGHTRSYEVKWKGKDGRRVPTIISAAPILDEEGRFKGSFAVITDITERERVEKALRESETSFRELADLLPQSVFELDLKGNFTYSNRCGFETFGYTREDLEKGVNALALYIPEERKRVEHNIRKRMTGEEFDDHEYTGLRKDGSIFPILVYSSPIIRDGKPVGVRGIVLDITDRKQVEEELRESEEKFEKAFHRNPSPMTISSLDGCFIDVNDAFALHLGYSREELIGQYASELGIFLDQPRREERFERLAAQGGPFSADEVELRTKTGETRWGLASYEIIEIKGERFILGVGIDITERKKTEEELREKQAKLLAQSRKLEEVNAALGVLLKRREEDKLELEENVLANVNDLVFPYLDRLRNSHPDPDQEILIEILESHLKDIISPFSARLSSRFSNLTPTEIQVASLIKDGKTTKEIASILNLSENTIISHRFHIRTKLGLRSRKMNLTSYLRSRHS
jgi:PAS domain S-box-containing protein